MPSSSLLTMGNGSTGTSSRVTPWDRLRAKAGQENETPTATATANVHRQFMLWLDDAMTAEEYNTVSPFERRALRSQFEKEAYLRDGTNTTATATATVTTTATTATSNTNTHNNVDDDNDENGPSLSASDTIDDDDNDLSNDENDNANDDSNERDIEDDAQRKRKNISTTTTAANNDDGNGNGNVALSTLKTTKYTASAVPARSYRCRHCGLFFAPQGIQRHERKCMPVYTERPSKRPDIKRPAIDKEIINDEDNNKMEEDSSNPSSVPADDENNDLTATATVGFEKNMEEEEKDDDDNNVVDKEDINANTRISSSAAAAGGGNVVPTVAVAVAAVESVAAAEVTTTIKIKKSSCDVVPTPKQLGLIQEMITQELGPFATQHCQYIGQGGKVKQCACLSVLHDDAAAQACVAAYFVCTWRPLTRSAQNSYMRQQLANNLDPHYFLQKTQKVRNQKPFRIPYHHVIQTPTTNHNENDDNHEKKYDDSRTNDVTRTTIENKLAEHYICKHTYYKLHGIGSTRKNTLEGHVHQKIIPVHGNTGRLSLASRRLKTLVHPLLKDFFHNEIIPLVTKAQAVPNKHGQIVNLLPWKYSKHKLYKQFAWKYGWNISNSDGGKKPYPRTDAEWMAVSASSSSSSSSGQSATPTKQPRQICCNTTFYNYWNEQYPNLIVEEQFNLEEKYGAKGLRTGPWSPEEIAGFELGMEECKGMKRKWKRIMNEYVPTRTNGQIRTHAMRRLEVQRRQQKQKKNTAKTGKKVAKGPQQSQRMGVWSQEEIDGFDKGMEKYGNERLWKEIMLEFVPTRSNQQIRHRALSHYEKIYMQQQQQQSDNNNNTSNTTTADVDGGLLWTGPWSREEIQESLRRKRCTPYVMETNPAPKKKYKKVLIRNKNSAGVLAGRIFHVYKLLPRGDIIGVDAAAVSFGVKRKMMYYVMSIFESISLVEKKEKNTYTWMGIDCLDEIFGYFQAEAIANYPTDAIEYLSLVNDNGTPLIPDQISCTDPQQQKYSQQGKKQSIRKKSQEFLQLFLVGFETLSVQEAYKKIQGNSTSLTSISTEEELVPLNQLATQEEGDDSLVDSDDKEEIPKGDDAGREFKIKARRLYDVASVFISIGLLKKDDADDAIATAAAKTDGSRHQTFSWSYKLSAQDIYKLHRSTKGIVQQIDSGVGGVPRVPRLLAKYRTSIQDDTCASTKRKRSSDTDVSVNIRTNSDNCRSIKRKRASSDVYHDKRTESDDDDDDHKDTVAAAAFAAAAFNNVANNSTRNSSNNNYCRSKKRNRSSSTDGNVSSDPLSSQTRSVLDDLDAESVAAGG